MRWARNHWQWKKKASPEERWFRWLKSPPSGNLSEALLGTSSLSNQESGVMFALAAESNRPLRVDLVINTGSADGTSNWRYWGELAYCDANVSFYYVYGKCRACHVFCHESRLYRRLKDVKVGFKYLSSRLTVLFHTGSVNTYLKHFPMMVWNRRDCPLSRVWVHYRPVPLGLERTSAVYSLSSAGKRRK